ncbi:MAG TPA: DNA ligase D, partial [Pseudonocardiaceae bacterium]
MAATSRRGPSGVPPWVEPMLAKPDGGRLPSGPHLSYEDKLDGYRCCARVAADGTVVLTSRNGRDFTDEFAVLVTPLAQVFGGQAGMLDGEIVVYNAHGQVDFGLLQERRGRYPRHRRVVGGGEPVETVDVRFMAFDLLRLGGNDLLGRPYEERRGQLAALAMPDPYRVGLVRSVTYEHLRTERLTPEILLQRTAAAGYEGLVAKVRTSTYQPGARSDAWLKHPLTAKTDVLICAFRPGKGGLTGSLGGLLLGAHDPA